MQTSSLSLIKYTSFQIEKLRNSTAAEELNPLNENLRILITI